MNKVTNNPHIAIECMQNSFTPDQSVAVFITLETPRTTYLLEIVILSIREQYSNTKNRAEIRISCRN